MNKYLVAGALLVLLGFTGCWQTMESQKVSEYGVVFSKLPRILGGGVSHRVIGPGQTSFIWPWEEVFRINTAVQYISWGGAGRGDNPDLDDFVETRARDGNEVGVAVTVAFQLGVAEKTDSHGGKQYEVEPSRLQHLLQNVGSDGEAIRNLVANAARADIRTHLNSLHTRDFFNPDSRERAFQEVAKALNTRFYPEGILIHQVIYDRHRFERKLKDGSIDDRYQKQIDETQAISQEIEREKKNVRVVTEAKRIELNEEQARVNRAVEEAEGFKRQATLRGDGYFEAKKNEAEQIHAVGMAEVEGLKKQVAAIAGPGGEALVKLAIAKELAAANPKFVILNSGQDGGGIDLRKVDTNELLRQLGLLSGIAEGVKEKQAAQESGDKK